MDEKRIVETVRKIINSDKVVDTKFLVKRVCGNDYSYVIIKAVNDTDIYELTLSPLKESVDNKNIPHVNLRFVVNEEELYSKRLPHEVGYTLFQNAWDVYLAMYEKKEAEREAKKKEENLAREQKLNEELDKIDASF